MGQSKIKLWPIDADPYKNFCDLCTQDDSWRTFQIASTRKFPAVGSRKKSRKQQDADSNWQAQRPSAVPISPFPVPILPPAVPIFNDLA